MTSTNGWLVDKSIPSDLELAHGLIEDLIQAMEKENWPGGDMFHVQMAMEEAVVNAIEHGNKREVDKTVHLVLQVEKEEVRIRITDQGSGFDHRNVADPTEEERIDKPRGRGVLLIRELMTEAHYNDIGNQVLMIKHRSPPADDSDEEE
jgi:serine/threonine-protein kinase RsbW